MGEYIEFSCGCRINEAAVHCMCLAHAQQLARKRIEARDRREAWHREMRESVEKAIRGSKNGSEIAGG